MRAFGTSSGGRAGSGLASARPRRAVQSWPSPRLPLAPDVGDALYNHAQDQFIAVCNELTYRVGSPVDVCKGAS